MFWLKPKPSWHAYRYAMAKHQQAPQRSSHKLCVSSRKFLHPGSLRLPKSSLVAVTVTLQKQDSGALRPCQSARIPLTHGAGDHSGPELGLQNTGSPGFYPVQARAVANAQVNATLHFTKESPFLTFTIKWAADAHSPQNSTVLTPSFLAATAWVLKIQ